MNNLSEEEIISICNDMSKSKITNYDLAVQGLLNLYKEEKNKYSDDKIRETIIKRYHEVIEKDYVSKDKIRELLKDVNETVEYAKNIDLVDTIFFVTGLKNSLEDLLELKDD